MKVWKCELVSRDQLCVSPWTVARQASLSMGFSREEYWSGLPFPPAGDLLNSGMEPVSCIAGRFCIVSATREANVSNVKETLENIKLLPFSWYFSFNSLLQRQKIKPNLSANWGMFI